MVTGSQKKSCKECKHKNTEIKRMNGEMIILQSEVMEAAKIIAEHNPGSLVAKLAPMAETYDTSLIEKVLAQGMIGAFPDETRGQLGISKGNWFLWRVEYPVFGQAVNRYITLCKSFWLGQCREALERGNWQFNHDKVHRMLEVSFKGEDLESDGDAARLVHIDLGGKAPTDVRKVGHNKPSTLR